MKKVLLSLVAVAALAAPAFAQTNIFSTNTPLNAVTGPLSTLESYILDNDTNYNGWASNSFVLWEAAVFANVNGTPGASSIGNDMGLEVPFHNFTSKAILSSLSLDTSARFDALFGDLQAAQLGLAYNYNLYQVQMSAGLDGRYTMSGGGLEAVPYFEFKKASTALPMLAPFIRYSYPILKKPGAGEVDIGLQISFGKL